jgi:hypothetical protein
MKKTKVYVMTAAVLLATLAGGCGEAPYTLTETEENIIVNYAAHITSKYNMYQKDGLTYVDTAEETTEELISETEVAETTDTEEESTENAISVGDGVSDETTDSIAATLEDVFGSEAVSVEYVGARLSTSYVEDSYYALDADADKVYLIVSIDVSNTTEMPVEVDYLTLQPSFLATVNDEYTSRSEITILTEDFSTLSETLEAGETEETVLLFQIPENITEIQKLVLDVTVDGQDYQIVL